MRDRLKKVNTAAEVDYAVHNTVGVVPTLSLVRLSKHDRKRFRGLALPASYVVDPQYVVRSLIIRRRHRSSMIHCVQMTDARREPVDQNGPVDCIHSLMECLNLADHHGRTYPRYNNQTNEHPRMKSFTSRPLYLRIPILSTCATHFDKVFFCSSHRRPEHQRLLTERIRPILHL